MLKHAVALLLLSLAWSANAHRVERVSVNDQVCDTCIVAVRILEDFLCDPAAAEFVLDLVEKQLCPSLPDVEQCDQIADALVPVLLEWLRASATPADLCSSAGVCGTTLMKNPRMNKAHAVKDGMECPLCEFVVNRVKVALSDPATQEQVKEAALAVCNALPSEMVAGCTNMVNTYEALLVAMVESTDTAQACAFVGLCAGSLAKALRPAPLPLPLLQSLHAARPRFESALLMSPLGGGSGRAFPQVAVADDSSCIMCKMLVLEVHTLLSNPSVQDSTMQYVKAMCGSAPADWQATCTTAVDTYMPSVFAALQQYSAQPDPLCQQLHMCTPPTLVQQLAQWLLGKTPDQLNQGFRLAAAAGQQQAQQQAQQQQADAMADAATMIATYEYDGSDAYSAAAAAAAGGASRRDAEGSSTRVMRVPGTAQE